MDLYLHYFSSYLLPNVYLFSENHNFLFYAFDYVKLYFSKHDLAVQLLF